MAIAAAAAASMLDNLQLIEINADREFSKVNGKSRADGITAVIAIWYNGSRCNKTRAYLTAPQNETSTDNCHDERAVRASVPQYLSARIPERENLSYLLSRKRTFVAFVDFEFTLR